MIRRLCVVLLAGLMAVACGEEKGTTIVLDGVEGVDSLDGSGVPDLAPADAAPDLRPELPGAEVAAPDVFVECEPGSGCFGEPCETGGDCLSGFCVDHMGDKVCTRSCVEECPAGWGCEPTEMGGTDLVYVCVSRFRVLCRPCVGNADCITATGQEEVCVTYGPDGRFCGASCDPDGEGEAGCPAGYLCQDVSAAGDGSLTQCVHGEGVCPCTDASVSLGLATVCEESNEEGTCTGERVCTADGLSECDAAVPAPEVCDGADNDCDGETDEATCDDANVCTQDSCGGVDGCQHELLTGTNCDDGDVCTVTDHCEAGVCAGSPIACDDSNPCTDDSCDGTQGCVFEPNNESCDDGDPCTIGDLCLSGACKGTPVECECQKDADCASLEDGDLCNGTLYCDTSGIQYLCKVNPASVVECPEPPGKDGVCLAAVCDPGTGKCSFVPANQGGACDDKDACTVGSTCLDGSCGGGSPLNCNDSNACTTDACDPAAGCTHAPAAGACSDDNACTWPDTCADGSCVAGPAVDCDDSNPCTADTCNPQTGCKHAPVAGACDDGNACTTGDQCQAGFCVSSGSKNCDDANPCTKDSCQPATGCLHEFNNNASCSDDDLCTVDDSCQDGVCVGGQALSCDDGKACTEDTCNPLVGCLHTSKAGACDDGDPCTGDDKCAGGECVGTKAVSCDDSNPCTDDVCVPMAGCSHANNTNPCSDGDVCTVNDVCAKGACVPGAPLDCDDGNVCTADVCDPEEGCSHPPADAPCDDNNECTTGDQCQAGVCKGQGTLECDDANPCTKDVCLPGGGCTHEAVAGSCSDGNPCTVDDMCVDGQCQPGLAKDCDDSNPCTDDTCGQDGTCLHAANQAACDDSNPCTVGDHCAQGACVPDGPLDCDDGDVCTTDYCHPLQGCVHAVNTAPCNDGDPCTLTDACADGICVGQGALNCNDGNPCTDDSCDAQVGCLHTPNVEPCDDDNACTPDDVCAGGFCTGSGAADCDDSNPCTDDSCDPQEGCLHAQNTVGCDDGNACTQNDVCADGSCQPGSAVTCNDDDVCTDDSCDPQTGCVFTQSQDCCVPSGGRAPFNSLAADTASGCWNGNVCSRINYSWSSVGQNFQSFGQYITCSGSQTCVQHVGITTYGGGGNTCDGIFDVYCDNVKKCTLTTLNKTCDGSSLSNGCSCTFPDAARCSQIKLVAVSDGDSSTNCCGGNSPDSMITAVSAW